MIDKQDERQRLVWSSGRTNDVGVIVDAEGRPLPSEFFTDYKDAAGRPQQHYQKHHEMITSDGQVQIYEELTRDARAAVHDQLPAPRSRGEGQPPAAGRLDADRPRSLAQRRVPRGDVSAGATPSTIPTIATARDPTR